MTSSQNSAPHEHGAALPGLDDLRARLSGSAFTAADPEFEALTSPWNLAAVTRPLLVVAVASVEDVAVSVRWARENGRPLAVQATGHGAGADLSGSVLLQTGRLTELTVDPETRRARIGAGVRWGAVLEAAGAHGLAALAGSSPTVGVVGYLTGGGVGPVARSRGLASDSVLAFDVVTADGVVRRATATENSDLFWGLRGGKGALGVVTAVELELFPQPMLYAGALYFDGSDAERVAEEWVAWAPQLPADATTSIAFLQLPPLPMVPPPLAGKLTVAVRFAWLGSPAEGEALLSPMREIAAPLIDAVTEMPFTALPAIHADPVDPMPSLERSALLTDFTVETAHVVLQRYRHGEAEHVLVAEFRQLGGAISRSGGAPSAVPHRDAAFHAAMIGIAAPPVAELTAAQAESALADLAPWTTGETWVNFVPAEDPEVIARCYDLETWARLSQIASLYDPDGLLVAGRPFRAPIRR